MPSGYRAWLKTEMTRSRKQRRTGKQIHADLVALGYDGSYSRVAAFIRRGERTVRSRSRRRAGARSCRWWFESGEAFQFDWSEDWAVLGGERLKLQAAHTKLSHSRAFIVRAYPLQTHEMLFDAHQHAFRVLGGVAAARDLRQHEDGGRPYRHGQGTAGQRALRGDGEPLSVRAGVLQSGVWLGEGTSREERPGLRVAVCGSGCPHFLISTPSMHGSRSSASPSGRRSRTATFPAPSPIYGRKKVPDLMKPGRPFDGFVEHTKRVSPTCLVHFDRNRYSVPASFANRPVSLRIYPDRIVVVAEGQRVCASTPGLSTGRTARRGGPSTTGDTIWRWSSASQVPCETVRPFIELPDAFRQLRQQLLRRTGGDREMVDILALVLQHDEQAVLCAVELALEAGVATKTHILNILHRLVDGKTASVTPIDAPQALVPAP